MPLLQRIQYYKPHYIQMAPLSPTEPSPYAVSGSWPCALLALGCCLPYTLYSCSSG